MLGVLNFLGSWMLGLLASLALFVALEVLHCLWSAFEEGPARFRRIAEVVAGLCYLTCAMFLMAACLEEIRSVYQHQRPLFWVVAVAFVLLVGKWWKVIKEHSDQRPESGPDL